MGACCMPTGHRYRVTFLYVNVTGAPYSPCSEGIQEDRGHSPDSQHDRPSDPLQVTGQSAGSTNSLDMHARVHAGVGSIGSVSPVAWTPAGDLIISPGGTLRDHVTA
jgi:hypothetical protein